MTDVRNWADLPFCKYIYHIISLRSKTKQEAHGPHRSPENRVQINKHKKLSQLQTHYLFYENIMVLYLNKLKSPSPKDAM